MAYRYRITVSKEAKTVEAHAFPSAFVADMLPSGYVANFINFAVKVSLLIAQFTLITF